MRRPEREHDRIFGRRSLQLKIERPAEPLSQGQAPGAIQTTAERRMNHDVRAAVLIKPLGNDLFCVGITPRQAVIAKYSTICAAG